MQELSLIKVPLTRNSKNITSNMFSLFDNCDGLSKWQCGRWRGWKVAERKLLMEEGREEERRKEELKGAREEISFSFSPVAVACIDWALSVACYRQRCLHQEHFTAFCWSRLQTDWFNWLWLESQRWVGDRFFPCSSLMHASVAY